MVRLDVVPVDGGQGILRVSSQADETGSNQMEVEAQISGPGLSISFNVKYLKETLAVMDTPTITLGLNQSTSPGVLRPEDAGQKCFHVIMPMHLV